MTPKDRRRVPLHYDVPAAQFDSFSRLQVKEARVYQFKTLRYLNVYKRYVSIQHIPAYWFGVDPPKGVPGYHDAHVTGRRARDFPPTGDALDEFRRKRGNWYELELDGGAQHWLIPVQTLDALAKLHAKKTTPKKLRRRIATVRTKVPMALLRLPRKAPKNPLS